MTVNGQIVLKHRPQGNALAEHFEYREVPVPTPQADEVVVRNAGTREEFSVPRRLIGNVSRWEDPVRVVALLKRLEISDGKLRPQNRDVIEMPVAVDAPRVRAGQPAAVVVIRDDPQPAPRWKHYLRISVALGCLACFVAVFVFRQGRSARVRRFSPRPARLAPHSPASVRLSPLQKR